MYLASEPEIQFWFALLIQIHCQSVMNRVNPLHQWIWYLVYVVLPVQTGFSQVSQTLQATWIPGLKMKLRKTWNCLPLLQLPLLSKTCQFQGAGKRLMWWKVTNTWCICQYNMHHLFLQFSTTVLKTHQTVLGARQRDQVKLLQQIS